MGFGSGVLTESFDRNVSFFAVDFAVARAGLAGLVAWLGWLAGWLGCWAGWAGCWAGCRLGWLGWGWFDRNFAVLVFLGWAGLGWPGKWARNSWAGLAGRDWVSAGAAGLWLWLWGWDLSHTFSENSKLLKMQFKAKCTQFLFS